MECSPVRARRLTPSYVYKTLGELFLFLLWLTKLGVSNLTANLISTSEEQNLLLGYQETVS